VGKKANDRRVADNEALAVGRMIRTSSRKLNLVAQSIRGLAVSRALAQLAFSKRRVAKDVKKVLDSAVANAENNHQLDVDTLVVAEAHVGKALAMRRFTARGRGRAASIVKEFSNITIVVRSREEQA
jgi:large subunit ribosomal protein L22